MIANSEADLGGNGHDVELAAKKPTMMNRRMLIIELMFPGEISANACKSGQNIQTSD